MQNQLEQLEKNYSIEWHEFRFDELFDNIVQGRRLKKQNQIPGTLPFVMAGVTNAGIVSNIGNDVKIYPENSITVDIFGNAFYRNHKYGMSDDVGAYWCSDNQISESSMLYIAAAIGKSTYGKFDFGNKLRSSKSLSLKIKLPVLLKDGDLEIAFDYMKDVVNIVDKEHLAALKAERLNSIKAYLQVIDSNDCSLTKDEQAALNQFGGKTWSNFKIEDVLVWQNGIVEINPLHLDFLSISKESMYPYYGQATSNNGVIDYRHLKNEVLNNKFGKPTILIHSNNQNIVYLETPFYLKDGHGATSVLQSDNLDKITAQFLMSAIKKVVLQKYTYNSKATKIELKNTEINLPVKSDGTPDYEYMRLFISAVQKIVVKDIDLIVERKINAANKIILK